jgi:hypothetical protein
MIEKKVAAILKQHAVTSWTGEGRTTGHCFCGAALTAKQDTIHAWTNALSDHQAEAVAAVIAEETADLVENIETLEKDVAAMRARLKAAEWEKSELRGAREAHSGS